MGWWRVGHDWGLHFHFSLSCIGEGNGNPLRCSCLENPRDGGAWWAAVYGVAQSQTQLKWLSSSSSSVLLREGNLDTWSPRAYVDRGTTMWGYNEKVATCKPRREASGETIPYRYLDLGLLASRSVRKQISVLFFVLFWYGPFLKSLLSLLQYYF